MVKKLLAGPVVDDKKRLSVRNRLSSMLFKQKEQLKKDIAKKRAQLEKELSAEISSEVNSLKQAAQLKLNSQQTRKRPVETPQSAQLSPARKKRRSRGLEGLASPGKA